MFLTLSGAMAALATVGIVLGFLIVQALSDRRVAH